MGKCRCCVSQVYNVQILENSLDIQLVRILVGCVSRISHDSFFLTSETPPGRTLAYQLVGAPPATADDVNLPTPKSPSSGDRTSDRSLLLKKGSWEAVLL